MKKLHKKIILFTLVIITAFFCRMVLLGSVPPGLTNDEADIGYDAYSILKTGKDQWSEFMPLTAFKGFGDYRLPLYTYLVIPAISVFDLNSFSVRLPSAIFGTISVILIYFLTKKLAEKSEISNEVIAFSAMTLMAIAPWAIGLSRIGIESNVAIAFLLSGILLFLYGEKRPILYILSFVFFASTFYTYTSYTLFTPLVIIILLLYFRKKILKHKRYILISLIVLTLLIAPLFISRSAAGTRVSQVTFIFSQDNVGLMANLNDRRGSCSELFPSIICKVAENKYIVFGNTFIRNYVNHFSPDFLYINGTTTQYSILPQRSLLFTMELLLLMVGIIAILKKKVKNGSLVLVLLLVSPLADVITGDGHFSRASNMMPFLFLIEGMGLSYVYHALHSHKRYRALPYLVILFVLIAFGNFILSYFSYFPKHYSHFGQFGYEELATKLNSKKSKYDRIYVSKFSNDTKQYIYFLFFNKYDPNIFQSKKNISVSDDNGWVSIDKMENIYFVDRLPSEKELEMLSNKNVLLVSHPSEFPEDYKFTDTIYDKNNNSVFTLIDLSDYLTFLKIKKTQGEAL